MISPPAVGQKTAAVSGKKATAICASHSDTQHQVVISNSILLYRIEVEFLLKLGHIMNYHLVYKLSVRKKRGSLYPICHREFPISELDCQGLNAKIYVYKLYIPYLCETTLITTISLKLSN